MPGDEVEVEGKFAEEGLVERIAAPQAVDTHALALDIEFATHEPVRPGPRDAQALRANHERTCGVEPVTEPLCDWYSLVTSPRPFEVRVTWLTTPPLPL